MHLRLTTQLLGKAQDPNYVGNGCDNPVFRFHVPNLVPALYKEHVDAWRAMSTLTPDDKKVWEAGADWLRELERGLGERLFSPDEHTGDEWWDAQTKALVSRRATSRRLRLPLGKEIDAFADALKPHLVVWLKALVNERNLELAMFPKSLLQHAVSRLRTISASDFENTVRKCHALYPESANAETQLRQTDFLATARFPCHVSHWPGLRLCPPFFPDAAALQPPPSVSMPRQGKYVVLHACVDTWYAKASIRDAATCCVDEMSVDAHTQTFAFPLALDVTDANADPIFETLSRLQGMHPRSFNPMHPDSPFAAAAEVLTPCVHAEGRLRLPEHALDHCEVGFSFTYMTPAKLFSNDGVMAWDKDEDFYEVKMRHGDQDHFFTLSSYVGFGLRLRHTLLSVATPQELRGQGVCVLVPDGLDRDTTENIMLTCIGWLRDLRLSDVKIISEGTCHAMCLGSLSIVTQKQLPARWASFHDGLFVCQSLGIAVQSEIHDQWKGKYRTSPLKARLVEKIRDFLLGHPSVQSLIDNLSENRFKGRTCILESIKKQLPAVLEALERDFGGSGPSTVVVSKCTLRLPTADAEEEVVVDVPQAQYHDWLEYCFEEWTRQSWWTELRDKLEECKGIVVSGGLFDCCPGSALPVFLSKLGPNAKTNTKKNRLSTFHGACLAIYADKGCQSLMVQQKERLPILKIK